MTTTVEKDPNPHPPLWLKVRYMTCIKQAQIKKYIALAVCVIYSTNKTGSHFSNHKTKKIVLYSIDEAWYTYSYSFSFWKDSNTQTFHRCLCQFYCSTVPLHSERRLSAVSSRLWPSTTSHPIPLIFSSAADIVSRAYPMPSHLLSVCLSVRPSINLFSNWIDSLSFHPIFMIFGLDVHYNIAQKVESKIFFASNFVNGSLITKMLQMGILEVFGNFIQKFLISETKLGLQALCVYFQASVKNCQIFRPFLAPNRAQISQCIGFHLFSLKGSTGFTRNLNYKLVGAIFVGV